MLDSITDKVKSVPPMVWLAGIGIILTIVILSRSKGGSGATLTPTEGVDDTGGTGGNFAPDQDQDIADLFALLRLDLEESRKFREALGGGIREGATPTPNQQPPRVGSGEQPGSGIRPPVYYQGFRPGESGIPLPAQPITLIPGTRLINTGIRPG